MTEIEERFMQVFGIEPRYTYIGHYPLTDENGIIQPPKYPEITSDILLNLEDILLKKHIQVETCFYGDDYYCSCTIPLCNGKANNKKDAFLEMLIAIAQNYLDNSDMDGEEDIYNQIHSLFSEVGE